MTDLTHRRQTERMTDGSVVLFAADGARNQHYGDHVWTLVTELAAVADDVVAWTAEYYNADEDEARELVDPDDIVSDAGAWDDPQYVSDLWQAMEYGAVKMAAGYRTQDGAVVIDRYVVEMTYTHEED